jgi:RHS repeat-associated protein
VVDKSGTEQGHVLYDAYGQVVENTLPEGLTDRLFTGQVCNSYMELYSMGDRWYDPWIGQWTTPDPIIPDLYNPASLNRYSYVYNNPTNLVDPSGHIPVWDILDVASFGMSLYDFANEPTWGNLGWLALDTVSLLPIIPSVGAVRHLGKLDEVGDATRFARGGGGEVIEIYGFRGTGRAAERFIETEPLIYAGHVGISFDSGKTIYGFTPFAPGLSNAEIIDVLKQHKSFPGQVLDDTALFHRAQDLAEQGYRTQVYVQSIPVSKADFGRIRGQVLDEFSNGPLLNKRYAFPGPKGCFNCATWPSSLGIPIPEPSGNLRLYIEELKRVGRPWQR